MSSSKIKNVNVIMSKKSNIEEQGIPKIWIPSGSTLLDLQIGGGEGLGWPLGRFCNIVGDKSSGKTFVAVEGIAANYHGAGQVQKQYSQLKRFRWCYDDGETGFTFNTKKLYNFDIKGPGADLYTSGTVQEFSYNYGEFLASMEPGDYGIYVLDSLDGLSNDALEKRTEARQKKMKKGEVFEEGSYNMDLAAFLSKEFFRTRISPTEKKNVLLIIVSQVRDKINAMFPTKTRGGGKALDFFCHSILWMAHLNYIMVGNRSIGAVTRVNNKKSKTPRPRRIVTFPFLFSHGIDDLGANIDFIHDLRTDKEGVLKDKAKKIPVGKEETIETVKAFLETHDKLEEYLIDKKNRTGRRAIAKTDAVEWIGKNKELSKLYDKEFSCIDRESLIEKAIEDPSIETTYREKTIEKWEEIEKKIIPKRRSKYGK